MRGIGVYWSLEDREVCFDCEVREGFLEEEIFKWGFEWWVRVF